MQQRQFKDTMTGSYITLKRLNEDHIPDLRNAALSQDIWRFNRSDRHPIDKFLDHYFIELNKARLNNTQVPYVVIQNNHSEGMKPDETSGVSRRPKNKIIGSSRFYDISFFDKRLAIGFTWYHPSMWGTKVNPETKLLLLQFVFEELKFNRVEFHIDSRNQRSINAVKKLGAKQEGILRKHKIVQGDFVRDTVVCSIINSEWDKVKNGLLDRLSG